MRFFISGAAALNREVAEWFHAAGILILEGYGLTETSAGAVVNHPDDYSSAPSGIAVPRHRGQDRRGRRDPDQGPGRHGGLPQPCPRPTAETLTEDGWLHTGDIGEIDDDGYLRITDRKKDLFKTSGGKYIAPLDDRGAVQGDLPLRQPDRGARQRAQLLRRADHPRPRRDRRRGPRTTGKGERRYAEMVALPEVAGDGRQGTSTSSTPS